MDPVDAELTTDDQNERKIMKLLLKVENGTPRQRKTALGQLTEVFYKLDVLVRPYVHKILVVIEPLLIDENHYARVDGREIISNLSKVAGLDSMIDAMHPDIDNTDEDVRNTTARAFSVVASTLGIRALLPFLKAVCKSQTSWHARHTGIKIVYQIAILMGREVVPDLRCLVMIIEHGLNDENQKVRTITALSLAALAEAAATVGIESFESVLNPLLEGIRSHRGKVLAAFLKAIGFLIPLMDSILIKELMVPLIREFRCTDENMNKIVLKVVKECVGGLEADYIQTDILPQFYKSFWVRRMAFYPRNCKQLAETTVEIAKKVGFHEIAAIVADGLKDESEPYRIMVMVTTEKLVANLGESDIDSRLEEILTDGILFSFERQTSDDANVILNGFVTVVKSLGPRVKPYLHQVCEVINRLLKNKSAEVRQQAADLISRIAVVMKECQEEKLVRYLWGVLYGCLGEEYPEVLGSILGALKAIVNVTDMTNMNPSVKDLLKYLTPISKNKHEKVQEHCLELLGHILDRDEDVPAGLLTAISLGVVQMLIAQKKGIRHAAVNRIGYIAINAGPQEVLSALLQNLNLQDQRNRVCTAVAIAIVAETCTPVIVLSALINKYWGVPQQLNVQRWVLQSLSFLFEYISDVRKEYIDAVTPVLEDALEHRDLVHRRAAASVVKHMSLGVAGLGCEETLVHILNYVWPNIIEKSPGVIDVVMEAIEGMRVALGATVLLNYTLQGLFHPARKVREVYWKIYNLLYIGAQDALVAAYPRLEDEDDNVYSRPELTMFV